MKPPVIFQKPSVEWDKLPTFDLLTLPKFNSEFTPEKIPFDPIGKDRLPFPPFFQGPKC